jgi:hypothetical protein
MQQGFTCKRFTGTFLAFLAPILKEVSTYPRGHKAVLFYLASFLLEAQYVRVLTYKSE